MVEHIMCPICKKDFISEDCVDCVRTEYLNHIILNHETKHNHLKKMALSWQLHTCNNQ